MVMQAKEVILRAKELVLWCAIIFPPDLLRFPPLYSRKMSRTSEGFSYKKDCWFNISELSTYLLSVFFVHHNTYYTCTSITTTSSRTTLCYSPAFTMPAPFPEFFLGLTITLRPSILIRIQWLVVPPICGRHISAN